MEHLGSRLKLERQRLGLSQSAMATLGGIQPNAQCVYERGQRSPRAGYLAKLSAAGADIVFLLTGDRTRKSDSTFSTPIADSPSTDSELAVCAVLTPAVTSIVDQLRTNILVTAEAMAEICRLDDAADTRTARDHIEECLDHLNSLPDSCEVLNDSDEP